MHDNVYVDKQQHIVDFAFNKDVVAVFPDMIRRSVPGYETIIPMTGLIAARHLGDEGTAYDLGCSLGASTLAILQQSQASNIRVIGVDNSLAMIEEAKKQITDSRAFRCPIFRAPRTLDPFHSPTRRNASRWFTHRFRKSPQC